MVVFWIFALVAFGIVEAVTVSLVSVWFCAGSAVALLAAALGAPMWLQVTLFFAVSFGVLAALRPLAKKYVTGRSTPTNADRVLGKVCVVTEDIDNITGTGAVRVDGKTWTARTADGSRLMRDALVVPVDIQGVKLIVRSAELKENEETVVTNTFFMQ